jgi:hypothetical protein
LVGCKVFASITEKYFLLYAYFKFRLFEGRRKRIYRGILMKAEGGVGFLEEAVMCPYLQLGTGKAS